jgi:excisionase family DNA binding protein
MNYGFLESIKKSSFEDKSRSETGWRPVGSEWRLLDPSIYRRPKVVHAPDTLKMDRALSVAQTADLLSLSTRTVSRLIATGDIRALKLSERRTGILVSEIERYLSTRPGS